MSGSGQTEKNSAGANVFRVTFENGHHSIPRLAGLPQLPEPPFRRAMPTTPADRAGARVDCFPAHTAFPKMAGASASALSLSRPAQPSLTLRPAGLLNRLRQPLSRGSSPAGYPAEPLVSYQFNRQLSVESTSTGDPRLRGALPATDMLPQLWPRNWAVFYSHRLVGMPRMGQRGVKHG